MSAGSLNTEEAITPGIALPSQVLPELWISFVSLTRSHLGALQTISKLPQVKLQETSPNSFILGDLDGNVAVSVNPATGVGSYETRNCGGPSVKGSWQLKTNGTAAVGDSEEEDMELAVEFFAQKLVAARSEGATR
jgi:hypothetical protein